MRLRWWIILGLGVACIVAVFLLAPRLAMLVVASRTPIPLGQAARLTGAGMHDRHAAAVVVETPPGTLHRIIEIASGRWLPRPLIGDGQTLWGQVTALPGLDWELRVVAARTRPVILGRPSPGILGTVVASRLAREFPGEWSCDIGRCTLTDVPGGIPDPARREFSFDLAGELHWRTVRQVSRFSIRRAQGTILVVPPTVTIRLETFAAELPILGNDEGLLRGWIELQANQWLTRQLAGRPWPAWLPLDSNVDFACAARVDL